MNQLRNVLFLGLMVALAACSGNSKKVVVMSSGKMQVDRRSNTITLDPGTQHNEEVLDLGGSGVSNITVKTSDDEKNIEVPGKGLYVLNLKQNDTLVGGLVNYGAGAARERISDRELTQIIDSTRKLILGYGASDETKTYFILPFTVKKISDNLKATVVGPYNSLPYQVTGGDDGQAPEVYKLYTNKQQRESLLDLFRRMK